MTEKDEFQRPKLAYFVAVGMFVFMVIVSLVFIAKWFIDGGSEKIRLFNENIELNYPYRTSTDVGYYTKTFSYSDQVCIANTRFNVAKRIEGGVVIIQPLVDGKLISCDRESRIDELDALGVRAITKICIDHHAYVSMLISQRTRIRYPEIIMPLIETCETEAK